MKESYDIICYKSYWFDIQKIVLLQKLENYMITYVLQNEIYWKCKKNELTAVVLALSKKKKVLI